MDNAPVLMCAPSVDSQGGISSVVAIYEAAGINRELQVKLVPTYRDGGFLLKIRAYLSALVTLCGALSRDHVRLIHLHSASRTSFTRKASIALIADFVFRVPVVFHIHNGYFCQYFATECGPIKRALIRAVLNRAAHVIALTEQMKSELRTTIGTASSISVVPNPAPTSILAADMSRPVNGHLRVLFLGVLSQSKGYFDLLKAIAVARQAGCDVRLRACGSGDVQMLLEMCRSLSIEGVVDFLGWVGPKERWHELLAADVLALPSYTEGQPMAIIEAMSAGTAIIATRVGGVPDTVLDGKEAILVDPGDVDSLAKALARCATEPDFRLQLGRQALVRARSVHHRDRISGLLRTIYDQVDNPANKASSE